MRAAAARMHFPWREAFLVLAGLLAGLLLG
jgi:hypothetical protein